MPVGLVVVGPNVKLLCLSSPLNFDFLSLSLLLTEHGGVVHLAPLRLELGTKQRLTSLNQRALEGHADVSRLDVFENVVFFPLEPDVHLVLKIESGFRVVVGSQVDFLSDASIDGQLNPLVKIKGGDRPVSLRQPRVFGFAVPHAKIQFRRSLRLDLNLVGTENGFEDFGVNGQLGSKTAFLFIQFVLHLRPELTQVLVDVVLQEFIERQVGRISEVQGVSQPLTHHILTRGLVVIHPVINHVWEIQTDPSRGFRRTGHVPAMRQWKVQSIC